jgi:hypothetical protein
MNPLRNALLAIAYIVGLVSLVAFGAPFMESQEESILLPMSVLAVLVLSVALMAYLFFYQPVIMLLEGQRKEAGTLFLKTVGIFAVATVLLLTLSVIVSLV